MTGTTNTWKTWKYRVLLLLAFGALVGLSACGLTTAASSPSSLGNVPAATGNNPEPGTSGQPEATPQGHSDSIIASGSVAYVGSDNGRIYALVAANGRVQWQRNLGGPVYVFAVTDGVVYVTAEGASTTVYALDAGTGAVKWQFQRGVSGLVLTAGDGEVLASTGSEGNKMTIFALRATTGALLWEDTEPTTLPGQLGVINGAVYLGQLSGTLPDSTSALVALDAGTGKMLWRAPINESDGAIAGAPVESNGILYLETTFGAVYALQPGSGAEVWHVGGSEVPGAQPVPLSPDSPLVANGLVYAGGPEGITAYRAPDGAVVWHFQKSLAGPLQPQLVLVTGVLYVNGFMLSAALNAADGSLLWQSRSGGTIPISEPPVVTDGVVITGGPTVVALRASDGAIVWQSSISAGGGGNIYAGKQEAVSDGVVFLSSPDGVVHAISATNGSSLWTYAIGELAVPTPPVYSALVTFDQTTTYSQALQTVTNLGLQTKLICTSGWADSDTANTFSQSHTLIVQASVASAPLWMNRLQATPGVTSAQPEGEIFACPDEPVTQAPPYLDSQQAEVDVQVAFASTVPYAAALEGVDGLGFRLASPCYEQARARGSKPTWQPMGQAGTYAKTDRLVLATTNYNATTWLEQLRALSGVLQITEPYIAAC